MKITSLFLGAIGLIWLLTSFQYSKPPWSKRTPVFEVLKALGMASLSHDLKYNPRLVAMGKQIVKTGKTIGPDGKLTKPVSKHYVCTTCHNLQREDPDLLISDPELRLPYVKAKGIPFLQGTTFKGIVNRESWYNDDYVKKYGDEKIKRAHKSLREAIQLCAVECSQGRPMERWEIKAVLSYFWKLQYRLGDIDLTEKQFKYLNEQSRDTMNHPELIQWVKSFYLQKSPAHFFDAPPNKNFGYKGLKGNAERGRDLYESSCLHCHKQGGVSHYILDYSKLTFRHLEKMIPKDSHMSLYQIIAYGTYAIPGHRPYMPHYPKERMSQQQVEDLRAFIERQNRGYYLRFPNNSTLARSRYY